MEFFNIYIITILIVSLILSFEDFKKGMIRNKYLTILSVILFLYFVQNIPEYSKIPKIFLENFSIALIVSLFFWLVGFWPAGDAKLFLIYSILMPIGILKSNDSIILIFMINTFVPIFIFYTILAFLRNGKNEIINSLKYAFDPYKVFLIFVIFLGLAWIVSLILEDVGIPVNLFTYIIILFLTIEIIEKITPVNLEFFYVALAIIRLFVDYKNIYNINFMGQMITVLFVFLFFRFFILRLTFYLTTRKVKIKDLKEGMRIAEGILEISSEDGKKIFQKIELIHHTIYDLLYHKKKKFLHTIGDEGLTEEDVKLLKKLRRDGKILFDEVLIHEEIPFAIFLLVGYLLTVYLNGDFISFLRSVL